MIMPLVYFCFSPVQRQTERHCKSFSKQMKIMSPKLNLHNKSTICVDVITFQSLTNYFNSRTFAILSLTKFGFIFFAELDSARNYCLDSRCKLLNFAPQLTNFVKNANLQNRSISAFDVAFFSLSWFGPPFTGSSRLHHVWPCSGWLRYSILWNSWISLLCTQMLVLSFM